MEGVILKTFLSLAVVIGLMFVLILFLKKFFGPEGGQPTAKVEIEILGHRMLQPKRSIFVVRILNKILIIGITEGTMNALAELDETQVSQVEDKLFPSGRQKERSLSSYLNTQLVSVFSSGFRRLHKSKFSFGLKSREEITK